MKYILIFSCILVTCLAKNAIQTNMVNKHNEVRKIHKVGAVTGNSTLVDMAQKCSEYYAKLNNIDHSCPFKNGVGENLGSGGPYFRPMPEKFANDRFDAWYNEKKHYNYKNPKKNDFHKVGHFTQVVWKDTIQIGCATAFDSITRKLFVTCLYSPPGNTMDKEWGPFKKNVLPPN